MSDGKMLEKDEHDMPDWEFDTVQDLKKHAHSMMLGVAARLKEFESDNTLVDDRPEGHSLATAVVIPCHDENDITRQIVYVGYCAEACTDNGLVMRFIRAEECPHTDQRYLVLLICTADSLAVEIAEAQAIEHPEKVTRIH